MGIYYKAKEIDYEKTLGNLAVNEQVVIPTSSLDIANIRAQVSKVSKKLPSMVFAVNKSINGAIVRRTE